jgi:hypothetical protein
VTRQESLRFRLSWIALLVAGLATLVFGVVISAVRSSDQQYLRAIGAASIGMAPANERERPRCGPRVRRDRSRCPP